MGCKPSSQVSVGEFVCNPPAFYEVEEFSSVADKALRVLPHFRELDKESRCGVIIERTERVIKFIPAFELKEEQTVNRPRCGRG